MLLFRMLIQYVIETPNNNNGGTFWLRKEFSGFLVENFIL